MTAQIKERPILFSGAMVRALLDGSKTQTRRALRSQVTAPAVMQMAGPGHAEIINEYGVHIPGWACPYGQPGDRLWVREAWARTHVAQAMAEWVVYREGDNRTDYGGPWKPSIHMPRAASRILLEIVSVRVERLQDISEEDAKAEGISPHEVRQFAIFGLSAAERAAVYRDAAVGPFQGLWQHINGVGSWDANPWVWVVEFKRVTP